jgi:hypothetical protein
MNYMYSDHAVLVGRTHHQAHLPVLLHAKSLLGVCGTHRCAQPARLLEFTHLLGGQYLFTYSPHLLAFVCRVMCF